MPPTSSKHSKLARMQSQTRVLRVLNGLLFCILGLALGMVVVATVLPQMRMLGDKQVELAKVEAAEAQVIAMKEDKIASYEALRDDREYLELHARDRLNLHRKGEKIYRIERER